jgi:UDP-N-acetylmuramoyl-L-alanyl-D-glutamate--2,6-diaminopimelate ligase
MKDLRHFPDIVWTSDSRAVKLGGGFIAISGNRQDGHKKIHEALDRGASAILCDESKRLEVTRDFANKTPGVGFYFVASTREILGPLISRSLGDPSHSMVMVGVTGTSGKTTTGFILHGILQEAFQKAGLIGTVEIRIGEESRPSELTTPGAEELQHILKEMLDRGTKAVVMEVSSHALDQWRTYGVAWDSVGFLNLSSEHLDYHRSMEEYFEAKKLLFTRETFYATQIGKKVRKVAVLNEWGQRLFSEVEGIESTGKWEDLEFYSDRLRGRFHIGGESALLEAPLVGSYNAENLSCAVTMARGLGISWSTISHSLRTLRQIPGRLERVAIPDREGPVVLVDYAHKPDALEKVLRVVRELMKGRGDLWVVFGCGGDRDRTKRPKMGEISARIADHVILTSDNPRTEDPERILDEILGGIPPEILQKCERHVDRREAVFRAIRGAKPGDWVLIAGKGHEATVTVGKQKFHQDDRQLAREALQNLDT